MCLVVDTCCLAAVFDDKNKEHHNFKPVLNWIVKGGGSFIYGGKKYKRELRKAARYLSLIAELRRQGRVIELVDREVDAMAKEIKDKISKDDLDDEHIIAIVSVAKCQVVCTNDRRAQKYLKRSDVYPKGLKRPRIYVRSDHSALCSRVHVVGVCKAGRS